MEALDDFYVLLVDYYSQGSIITRKGGRTGWRLYPSLALSLSLSLSLVLLGRLGWTTQCNYIICCILSPNIITFCYTTYVIFIYFCFDLNTRLENINLVLLLLLLLISPLNIITSIILYFHYSCYYCYILSNVTSFTLLYECYLTNITKNYILLFSFLFLFCIERSRNQHTL